MWWPAEKQGLCRAETWVRGGLVRVGCLPQSEVWGMRGNEQNSLERVGGEAASATLLRETTFQPARLLCKKRAVGPTPANAVT